MLVQNSSFDILCMIKFNSMSNLANISSRGTSAQKQSAMHTKKVAFFNKTTLLAALKYVIISASMIALSNAEFFEIRPFGGAFFLALALLNVHLAILIPIFLATELLAGGVFGLFGAVIIASFTVATRLTYNYLKRSNKRTLWLKFTAPLLFTTAPIAFVSAVPLNALQIILFTAFSLAFLFVCLHTLRPILIENLRYKMLEVEIICLAFVAVAIASGLSNFAFFGFPAQSGD